MTNKEKLKFQQFYNYLAGPSEVPMGYTPAGSLAMEEAFNVYREGYLARLSDALADTYESIFKFAGPEVFFEVCEDYIRKNPSTSYNLNDYGSNFPDYIKTLPVSNDYPFLQDLALLEQNRNFLFHQKSESGLDGATIQSLLKEDSKLSFVASMIPLRSEYDIATIWKHIQKDHFDLQNIKIYEKPSTLLLFKDGDTLRVLTLSAKAFKAFKDFQSGKTLSETLKNFEPEEVTELFKNLMSYQLIRNVS